MHGGGQGFESPQLHHETMSKRIKPKPGFAFEGLIAWIQQCVHDRAQIEVNKKVRDIDTGKVRQIDIGIRLTDGPTEFFAIVEIRDHKRPIGVSYVEEVSAKRQSVKADAVFLVSRSGFTQTALVKAKKLGIRALTYDQATREDWSNWLQCQTLTVYNRKYDKANIVFAEFGSNQIMTISPETLHAFKDDKNAKILRTEDGNPRMSFPNLVQCIVNSVTEQLFKDIPLDGSRQRRSIVVNEDQLKPSLYIEGSDGKLRRMGKIKLELDCYCEQARFPFKLMKYHEAGAQRSIAEVATADLEVGANKFRIELIAPGAGACIPAGAKVSLRATKLG